MKVNWNKYHFYGVALVAIIVPTLIMLPVLIWPHYGLFSDADQVIDFPKFFWNHPAEGFDRILRPFGDGRFQPLFYLLNVLIYLIKPNSSLIYYLVLWAIFVFTSFVTAWVVYRLTKLAYLSVLAPFIFCFSSSIYENFYTLDKIEPRTTFFAAILLVLVIKQIDIQLKNVKNERFTILFLQLIFGIFLVYSKETGIFFGGALFITWIGTSLRATENSDLNRQLRHSFTIQFLIVASFFILFKSLWRESDEGRYLSYSITSDLVANNFIYYVKSSPELLIAIIFSLYKWIKFAIGCDHADKTENNVLVLLICACALIYFLGILIWRWPLDYFILPAHFFSAIVIPVVGSEFYKAIKPRVRKGVFIFFRICIISGSIILVSIRLPVGFLIYQQDELKDQLALELSEPRWADKKFILPFNHPNSAEIGERIEYFSNLKRSDEHKLILFNFWEHNGNVIGNVSRFETSVGSPPVKGQLSEVASKHYPMVIWKFGVSDNAWPKSMWSYDQPKVGDILIVPYGQNIPSWVNARGIGLFRSSFEFPKDLETVEVADVSRQLYSLRFGWRLFVITKLPA